ncbi:MAG: helix-turn-helix domain-containing protein [Planctomycetota bacterium]|nr:helix-turn-helix domain-containing protein [Planctomycetota bacterium]
MDDFADYTGGGGVGGVPDSTGGSTKPHQSLGRNFGKNPVPPGGPTDITQLAPGQRPDESTPPDMAYRGLPVMFMRRAGGTIEPAPFLMTMEEVADLLRLRESGIRNPEATLRRYRKSGLQCVRVSRRVLFRLDDVLRWLDGQRAESVG